ncbi:MAG: polysaccharide biosynthesis C-terminal domain-containing protein, partial [Oscillospiraceae bacterium]|nr:polysaccharide biosynthesis C-terminal domain-containing protein [Oscillospiraceae bacterium]
TAIPISIGSLVLNFTSLVDSVTVVRRLYNGIVNNASQYIEAYGDKLKIGLTPAAAEETATAIYGMYTGMALTVAVLIPDIVSMLGKSSLPNVAAAWLARDKSRIKYNIESLTRLTALISMPAGIGMCVLANPILSMLFPNRPNDTSLAASMLSLLAVVVIFIAIVTPLFNVFQAIGRSDLPIKFMLAGAVVKLTSNYILVGIPAINVKGAPIGTLLCYILIFCLCFYFLPRLTRIRINFTTTLIKPLISSLVCGAAALAGYLYIPGSLPVKIFISVACGAVFYAIMLILLRALCREDIISLPKGEKIAKTLEKFKIIG